MRGDWGAGGAILDGWDRKTVIVGGAASHVTDRVRGYTESLCGWAGPGQLDAGFLGLGRISSAHAVMRVLPQYFGTVSTGVLLATEAISLTRMLRPLGAHVKQNSARPQSRLGDPMTTWPASPTASAARGRGVARAGP